MPQVIEDRIKPAELPRLSPSSINLFIQEPALWVLKHFYGLRGQTNIYADRGKIIEDAMNAFFKGDVKTMEEAQNMAVCAFQNAGFFWGDDDVVDDIESKIPTWVEISINEMCRLGLSGLPKGSATLIPILQKEVETEIAGLRVGGFIDYTFPTLQTDLKTANTIPSPVTRGPRKGMLPKDKAANVRQQSVYWKCTGMPTSLLYTSPDEAYHHVLGEDESLAALAEVEDACKNIKKLLQSDLDTILSKTIPNWKTMEYGFYWDEKLRIAAHDVWWDYAE